MLNSSSMFSIYEASTPKLYLLTLSLPGFVPSSALVLSSFTALELQVSAQFSEDFLDDLVRSSQQQVVHMECE